MVIFEDLRKLLLYQKLNFGFECYLCKKKFYNRTEHLEHTRSCKSVPDLKCPKCGKTFGHLRILNLHLQLHNLSESSAEQSHEGTKTEGAAAAVQAVSCSKDDGIGVKRGEDTNPTSTDVPSTTAGEPELRTIQAVEQNDSVSKIPLFNLLETGLARKLSSHKTKGKPKQAKKQVGLTKIKMEDCLRCDACSCIYIDEKDYYKHMRNFHRIDMNNAPIKQQKTKKKCRSCCKQCRGSHCTPVKRPRATQRASNLIFQINMADNIKNRWTQMVSHQLNDRPEPDSSASSEPEPITIKPDPDADITIKQEPDLDLSYLLSQVEVKIKTEPDEY